MGQGCGAGIQLYWVIVPLAVMLLLAVVADYNLVGIDRGHVIPGCDGTGW